MRAPSGETCWIGQFGRACEMRRGREHYVLGERGKGEGDVLILSENAGRIPFDDEFLEIAKLLVTP